MEAHKDSSAGSLSNVGKVEISSRRIYLLFGLNLFGFALIFLLDLAVTSLIDDLNEELQNEQSRVLIGELEGTRNPLLQVAQARA